MKTYPSLRAAKRDAARYLELTGKVCRIRKNSHLNPGWSLLDDNGHAFDVADIKTPIARYVESGLGEDIDFCPSDNG